MQEAQDQERKAKKTQKKQGRGGAVEGGQRGRGRGGKAQTEFPPEQKKNKGFAGIYDN